MEKLEPTRHTILVVEDEGLIRCDTSQMLREKGFAVIEAADAQEALAKVRSAAHISLLFTDIHMPGPMDGLELAHCVHRLHPAIRLILTSGKTTVTSAEMPDRGEFIPKPYSPEMVGRVVSRALT